ncbi:hypothetical protein Tco_0315965 [Tanacetum coccineum]
MYCRGKENGVNILKSIDEGPFQMGTFWETFAEGNEGALHLGPELPRVYSNLSPEDKDRYNADIRATNILLQGFPKDIYPLINHYTDAKDIWDKVKMLLEGSKLTKEDREITTVMLDFKHFRQHKGETIHDYYKGVDLNNSGKSYSGLEGSHFLIYVYVFKADEAIPTENKMDGQQNRGHGSNARGAGITGYGGAQNRVGNANPGQAMQVKCYTCKRSYAHHSHGTALNQASIVLRILQRTDVMMQAQEIWWWHRMKNTHNVDNVFQADDCDAFDSDVDEAPTTQTMFMANLSSVDPVYDKASPSYDSDVLSKVNDHDQYQDVVCEHHEEHEMHDDVQPNYVVDSHADYTSDSNMIPYDQYVKDNAVPFVQSNVDNSLTVELATYKEQVELYERWARFELTEKDQKIDEQLRIVITNRNIKEDNLKKELHFVKLQLASTINHNKSMVEEVHVL